MTSGPLRAGIIGAGRISDLHAIEYLQNPAARLVALCDRDAAQARAKARAWGVPDIAIDDDIDRFLARPDIDLVEILLPHHLHLPVAKKAMAAGKIVSLQKPMCLTLAEADELVAAAEAHDRPVKIFENFIFYPPVLKARALIDEGAIGTPLSIRIKSNPARSATAWKVPAAANAWRQEHDHAGGGPLVFDDGHHKFALAWHFMGDPEEVHAFINWGEGPGGIRFDAQSMISFRFPGNRVGNLEVVYSPEMEMISQYYAQDDRVEITGTRGVIFINGGHGRLAATPPVSLYRDGALTHYDVPSGWEQSFVLSTRDYIEAIGAGRPPLLTPRQGRQVLRFALAAEQSAREGRSIRLSE
ncbi:MAG: Gfo/Idh/MocA family oxidoreductase [Rubellimicrobium sp.]|nr:Gfo/Idh/MocA family oxidoreductase [Rubellimicrobium sp.]